MKKFFISAAIIAMAFAASAQRTEGGKNLVINGSFDDPGLVQAVPGEWNYDPMNTCRNIEVLPGWEVSTGGVWNGGIEVMDDPVADLGDGDTRPDDDYQWLRFFTDCDNSWTSVTATQHVTGLEVGKTYTLNFVICGDGAKANGDGSWDQDPSWHVAVAEVDVNNEGKEQLGKEIMLKDFTDVEADWTRRSYEFKAPATDVMLQFYFSCCYYDPAPKHTQGWMGIDCVDLYDPNGTPAGVADVVVEENAPVEYFNLQGIRVANPENGVFIRRQGDKAVKVAL